MPITPETPLRIIPLGGVGEIGKNMYVFEYGDDIVVIDCGLMFPDEEMFGIDLVIPDVTYLKERRANVKAFLITHAHEDHVGALPYVLPEFPGVPVYASTLARGLLGNKIKEHKLHNNPVHPARPGRRDQHRTVQVIPFRVGHSIPDAMGLALRTPVGTIVHTGDFKFDHTPVDGKLSDFAILARLGAGGRRVPAIRLDPRRESRSTRRRSGRSARPSARSWSRSTGGSSSRPSRAISRGFSRSSTRPRTWTATSPSSAARWSRTSRSPPTSATSPTTHRGSCPRTRSRTIPTTARHRDDRRPGRADGRPCAHGQSRPPLRRDPAGRHRHRQRKPDPGQRGIRLADDRQPVQGRRKRLLPHHQARTRFRAREPGGS